MSLTIGEAVGPYRVVEQLGQGGMATVFKAYHAALDRYVAIKVLHPAFKEDPNFLARFQREARVIARLEHPNIVPVYDFAEHNGAPYLVMKFVEGETLKARLMRGPVALGEVQRYVEAVGAALDHAHRQGILHRDIKPSNIMLARDGNLYLADFGLARIALAGESTLSTDSLLGTPHYMSPEQAKGVKDLDAGTDIYSFGVVVYELLVGRVPFSADTPYAVIHDHIFTPLPLPRSINPRVPEAVERVLVRALAKERSERYRSVNELLADLRPALSEAVVADDQSGVTVIAPSRPLPASPDAETPVAATVRVHPEPAAAAATIAALGSIQGTATVGPEAAARPTVDGQTRPARTPWRGWYLAAGAVVIAGLGLGALALRNWNDGASPGDLAATSQPAVEASLTAPEYLAAAEQAFSAGHSDDGLRNLDLAISAAPDNGRVWLQAGDIALLARLSQVALEKYYLPALGQQAFTDSDVALELQTHAALAFYVAAADPEAEPFLEQQVQRYPEQVMPALAMQRFRVFHSGGEGVPEALQALLEQDSNQAGVYLIYGDYLLARGQMVEAGLRYGRVANLRQANRPMPGWITQEARCNVEKLRTERNEAQLEVTCADLSSLLTGK